MVWFGLVGVVWFGFVWFGVVWVVLVVGVVGMVGVVRLVEDVVVMKPVFQYSWLCLKRLSCDLWSCLD